MTFGTGFVDILSDSQAIDRARDRMVGNAVKARPVKRRRKAVDLLKEIRPRPNEGHSLPSGSRIASLPRLGAARRTGRAPGNRTTTRTPSVNWSTCVAVRVVPTPSSAPASPATTPSAVARLRLRQEQQAGDKSSVIGYAVNEGALFRRSTSPTTRATTRTTPTPTPSTCSASALRQACVYQITVRGFSDPVTGAIYNVDTVLNVHDEVCGVDGPMWVEKRVFRKSRAGNLHRPDADPC